MRIDLDSVCKKFSDIKALDNVSVSFTEGQIVAVLGANGAGKSTLLRCLCGLTVPDRGQVKFDGEVFRRDRLDLRRKLFFLPDFPYLFSYLDVIRQIGISLKLYECGAPADEENVASLFEEFDLLEKDEVLCSSLSRGQAYKVGLITLLAVDPILWLLDEPFASGMDPLGILSFKKYARKAASQGRTIIYTTQILELAESFSDIVCVLNKGKVHACDTMQALREQAGNANEALVELFQRLRQDSDGPISG